MKKREDFTQDSADSPKFAPDSPWQAAPAGKTGETPQTAPEGKAFHTVFTGAASQTASQAGNGAFTARDSAAADQNGTGTDGSSYSADSSAPGAADPGKPLTLEEQIAELEAKYAEANDNYLRKAADFENFRKRMNQEKSNAIDFANQTLLLDLASVIDDFERAIKSAETQKAAANGDSGKIAAAFNGLYEGISLIEKNLLFQLENKWGLKRFDSAGEIFDPNRHEAIMMEKSAGQEEPLVAEEFIKGYLLKERVIRPAKVKVVMPEK